MSDPLSRDQTISGRAAAAQLWQSGFGLALAAALMIALALFLPFISASISVMGMGRIGNLSGQQAAGWTGWLALLLALVAAAAWKLPQLRPYRMLALGAAALGAVLMLVWGWFFNPVAEQAAQLAQMTSGLGARNAASPIAIGPHVGMALVVVAVVLLGLAWKRRA